MKAKIQKGFGLGALDEECRFKKLMIAGVVLIYETSVEIDGKVFTNVTKTNFVICDIDLFNEKVAKGYIICENILKSI